MKRTGIRSSWWDAGLLQGRRCSLPIPHHELFARNMVASLLVPVRLRTRGWLCSLQPANVTDVLRVRIQPFVHGVLLSGVEDVHQKYDYTKHKVGDQDESSQGSS